MTSPPATIVLTGFMGTGKSTVGRIVAERLGVPFVDTDAEIEREHGRIADIFAELGEARFRQLEREMVDELVARNERLVIATGGGMLVDPANAAKLAATGSIYTLTAEPDEIVRRVEAAGAAERPLLDGPDASGRVRQLLADRAEVYAQFPQIATGGRRPEAIADEIIAVASGPAKAERARPRRRPQAAAVVAVATLVLVVVVVAILL